MGKKHNSKGAKGPSPQMRSRNTRSSKGRLLTDPAFSTIQLNDQLSMLGLYAVNTLGDGNCLFRALSDQLHGSDSLHATLRREICNWIEEHKARYEPFVEDERGIDAHIRCMRANATFGGHMELSAFAHMTRRNVKVIQPGLVYVIEWATGETGESSSSASSSGSGSTPRRSTRSTSVSVSTASPSKKERAKMKAQSENGEEVRVKTGRGYYVLEEVSSSDEDDDEDDEVVVEALVSQPPPKQESGGPTVYVAYHDWEHFSSIRNSRGPHTGLPEICEMPPPDAPVPPDLKDRERERKKERERQEKEKKERERTRKAKERADKEAGLLTVKLKLPSPSQVQEQKKENDPTLIPLPSSRSASPYVFLNGPSDSTSSLASTSVTPVNPHHNHNLLQTPRSQYRSPKRSFDESSASGGEDEGQEKRSRRRVGSRSGRDVDVLPDTQGPPEAEEMLIDVEHVDPDADTPGLSAPGTSSSSSSSASSDAGSDLSSSSSTSPSPEPVEQPTLNPSPLVEPTGLSKRAKQKYIHGHTAGGEKHLTKRQRKALGLPKVRSANAPVGSVVSAGKIVIPGGRWKGRIGGDSAVGVVEGEADADGEWRRNGAGRLDVRGFRELKI
ncbi:unnamed protein product [Cyclocybe aegerita]|uniref:OTU domain-containing protein n=1 Tax=Cyclocybe aegerita TaxID=1973307 RepID=A0A8S0WS14_CYCAE|nr:unnamed protein product [Cyclocybe aegerita]